MTYQLDTSGSVGIVTAAPQGGSYCQTVRWSGLSPFAQGYIEAAFADLYKPEARGWTHSPAHGGYIRPGHLKPGTTGAAWDDHPSDVCAAEAWDIDSDEPLAFHMIAPETLARIIADCAAGRVIFAEMGPATQAAKGRQFWADRQDDMMRRFPHLTVQLGDDGKVRFA